MLPRKRTVLGPRAAGGDLSGAGALQLSPEDGDTWEAGTRAKICGQKPKGLTYDPWKCLESVRRKAAGVTAHHTPMGGRVSHRARPAVLPLLYTWAGADRSVAGRRAEKRVLHGCAGSYQ